MFMAVSKGRFCRIYLKAGRVLDRSRVLVYTSSGPFGFTRYPKQALFMVESTGKGVPGMGYASVLQRMKRSFVAVLLLCTLLLTACHAPAALYQKISAEEAHRIIQETEDYILLDVRTDWEFAQLRIEGAVLIPEHEIGRRAAAELPDKNVLILVYCRRGRRSEIATRELVAMGYTNAYDIGGLIDWPYDTVGLKQMEDYP